MSKAEIKKFKFVLNTGIAGHTETKIIELPAYFSEKDIEREFKEWVWDQLDAWWEEEK